MTTNVTIRNDGPKAVQVSRHIGDGDKGSVTLNVLEVHEAITVAVYEGMQLKVDEIE